MPDMSIRGFSEEDYAALKSQASAAGKSFEAWAREILLATLKAPVVKERYAYRVYAATGGRGKITRHSDHVNGTSATFSGFNQHEADGIKKAEDLIRRNEVGDREKAVALLQQTFEEVVEVPV